MARCYRCLPKYEPAESHGLCRMHLHPGQVFFLGRWRTPEEAIERIAGDRVMRGVVWTEENGVRVGRMGRFEIRLRLSNLNSTSSK